jgi:large subunit ribosomal protein L17
MRHQKHKYKLNCSPSHRKSLVKGLSAEVIDHGKIKTTSARCKALRPVVEKLITLAKVDSVANRRLAFRKLNNDKAVKKLFTEVAPKYVDRKGGYTRITKFAEARLGDGAELSYLSLV